MSAVAIMHPPAQRSKVSVQSRFGALMSPQASPVMGPVSSPHSVPPMMTYGASPTASPITRSMPAIGAVAPPTLVLGAAPTLVSQGSKGGKGSLSRTTTPNELGTPGSVSASSLMSSRQQTPQTSFTSAEHMQQQKAPSRAEHERLLAENARLREENDKLRQESQGRPRALSEMALGSPEHARPRAFSAQTAFAMPSPGDRPGVATVGHVVSAISSYGAAPSLLLTSAASAARGHAIVAPGGAVVSSSPAIVRAVSPRISVTQSPTGGGGAWTTVAKPKRVPKDKSEAALAPSDVPKNDGEAVDIYYDSKELFVRGFTRDMKQSRNFKAKKKTDYQVNKRKEQSNRDRGGMDVGDGDSD